MSHRQLPPRAREIAADQGWDNDTIIMLLMCFIDSQKAGDALVDYLEVQAEEENADAAAMEDTA